MYKRILKGVLIAALLSFILCGCGEKWEPGTTSTLEVMLGNGKVIPLEVPVQFQLSSTDNNTFWHYVNDEISIYMTSNDVATAAKPLVLNNGAVIVREAKALAFSVDGYSFIIEGKKDYIDFFFQQLQTTTISESDLVFDTKYLIEELPAYTNREMCLDGYNFYMPLESTLNDKSVYMSSIYTENNNWIESWTKDCSFKELQDLCLQLLYPNYRDAEKTVTWYQDADILFAECGQNVFGAKRIAGNQYYIYYASTSFVDYVLQGLDTLHRE